VGPPSPQHTFLVHKNTICNKSPFFAAAFDNGNFIKGQTQAMSLEDIEGEVFDLSIELIYTDKIKDPYETPLMLLAKVWTLGERFLMPVLQNAAMSCLVI
jgi:hypothetical protein